MRYLLSGYGTDSKSGDVKQYRTLRGKIDIAEDSIKFRRDGVTSGDKSLPCVTFDGKTIKRNKDSVNNSASLILFDISEDEALELSTKFAEYALFLRANKPVSEIKNNKQTISFEQCSEKFAETASEVLLKGPRSSIIKLFEKFAAHWEKDAGTHLSLSKHMATLQGENFEKAHAIYSRRSAWRLECVRSLRNLLNHYEHGESLEDGKKSSGLRAVHPEGCE